MIKKNGIKNTLIIDIYNLFLYNKKFYNKEVCNVGRTERLLLESKNF